MWNGALAEFSGNVVFPGAQCRAGRCDLEWRLSPSPKAQEANVPVMYRQERQLAVLPVGAGDGNTPQPADLPDMPCMDVCDPSAFYRFRNQLGQWFRDIIGS